MKFTKQLFSLCVLCAAVLGGPVTAQAALLFDNTNNSSIFDETRAPDSGIMAQIIVGNAPVVINQFGVFGQMELAGNANWAIFDGTNATPLFTTGLTAVGPSRVLTWYDSPVFADFTLAANTTYYMGVIADQEFIYHWYCCTAPTITMNGLTSLGGNGPGSNGNAVSAAAPTIDNRCCFVQQNTRIFGGSETTVGPQAASVPEPSTLLLLALAAITLALRGKPASKRYTRA